MQTTDSMETDKQIFEEQYAAREIALPAESLYERRSGSIVKWESSQPPGIPVAAAFSPLVHTSSLLRASGMPSRTWQRNVISFLMEPLAA
jgi:hypothetical protein